MTAPWGYNTADFYNSISWEPQRDWLFEFIIKDIQKTTIKEQKSKNLNSVVKAINDVNKYTNAFLPSILKLSLTDITMPSFTINTEKVKRTLNKKQGIPTGYSWGDLSLTFLDDVRQDISSILMNWMNQVIDPLTGEYGQYKDFKKKGCLAEYSGDGTIVRFWIFDGIFPKSFSKGHYSRTGNGLQKLSLTLNVDQAAQVGPKDLAKYGFLLNMFV